MSNVKPLSLSRPNAVWADGDIKVRSSAVSECRRALYYSLMDVPVSNPVSESSRFIMDTGTALEDVVIDAVVRQGEFVVIDKQVPVELPITDGLTVTGHIDVLLLDVGIEEEFVGEVKTRGSEAYKNWEVLGVERSHPNTVQQMAMYVYARHGDAKDAYIFVMNVGDRIWGKERVPASQIALAFQDATRRLKEFNDDIRNNVVPDKEYHRSDWICQQCSWYDVCWNGVSNVIDDNKDFTAVVDTITEDDFKIAVRDYVSAVQAMKSQDSDKESAKTVINNYMTQNGLDAYQFPGVANVKMVHSSRKNVNWAELNQLFCRIGCA